MAEGLTKASGGKIVYDSIKWVNVLEEDGILDGMDVQDFMTRPSWPTYSKIPEKLKSKLEDKYGMVIEEKPAKTGTSFRDHPNLSFFSQYSPLSQHTFVLSHLFIF